MFFRKIYYRGGFMLGNQFQMMIHLSLIHFLWSYFQVIIIKLKNLQTPSGWSRLALDCLLSSGQIYTMKAEASFWISEFIIATSYWHYTSSDEYINMKIKCCRAIEFFDNSCVLQCTLPLKQLFPIFKIEEKQEQRS